MKSTTEEDRLAKRLAVVERDNARLREGPPADVGLKGCGDHGCLVSPAKGVGTNGGCRCPEVVLRRMIHWQAREIAKLRGGYDLVHETVAVGIERARLQLPPVVRTPTDARERVIAIICEVVGQVEARALIDAAFGRDG